MKPITKHTFVIDTDAYAGNFERELFAFITGMSEVPGEDPHGRYEMEAGRKDLGMKGAYPTSPFDDLLDCRIRDPGDDGYHRTYVTIIEDRDNNFNSVGIFLQRAPTPTELKLLKSRAELFKDLPKKHVWDQRPSILGYRLLTATTTITLKEL